MHSSVFPSCFICRGRDTTLLRPSPFWTPSAATSLRSSPGRWEGIWHLHDATVCLCVSAHFHLLCAAISVWGSWTYSLFCISGLPADVGSDSRHHSGYWPGSPPSHLQRPAEDCRQYVPVDPVAVTRLCFWCILTPNSRCRFRLVWWNWTIICIFHFK